MNVDLRKTEETAINNHVSFSFPWTFQMSSVLWNVSPQHHQNVKYWPINQELISHIKYFQSLLDILHGTWHKLWELGSRNCHCHQIQNQLLLATASQDPVDDSSFSVSRQSDLFLPCPWAETVLELTWTRCHTSWEQQNPSWHGPLLLDLLFLDFFLAWVDSRSFEDPREYATRCF